MQTKRFCELIELAIMQQYGEESEFDTVPYINDEGKQAKCLGVFLTEEVHMAVIVAKAQHILWTQMGAFEGDNSDEADIDEAMGDFADLMQGMRIAPYMQWHCAYFPYLTADQIEAEEADVVNDPKITRNRDHLPEEARDVLIELIEVANLEGVDLSASESYIYDHADDIVDYRNNGMKISEIVDTIRSLANIKKDAS